MMGFCSKLLFFFFFCSFILIRNPVFAQGGADNHAPVPPSSSNPASYVPPSKSNRPVGYVPPHVCSESGNYTTNSSYSTHLRKLMDDMSSMNASINTAAIGNDHGDLIAVIILCRGDILPSECHDCVTSSTSEILVLCPNQKEAIVWYGEKCMLRYSNRPIIRVMELKPSVAISDTQNVSDVEGFNKVLKPLLGRLIIRAASGDSTPKFAMESVAAPGLNQTLYAYMACTPDLDQQNCTSCLQQVAGYIPQCCDGKQGVRYLTPSCNLRYENYSFFGPNAVPSPPPPPVSPPPSVSPPLQGKEKNATRTVIIIVVSIVIATTLVIGIGIFLRDRKSEENFENMDEITSVESLQFDFSTIGAATNNFSDANEIGKGGFGAVYRGRLSNGQEIAVKRLSMNSRQGDVEFKNEVLLVAKLQHRNLVRLLGFCLEGNERILIYEFVPNTSLNHYIFDPMNHAHLNWERRYKIIGGIARGLLYLHEDSRLRIIHRDLKAANVLLDAEMNPKISDFGMARMFVLDQTEGNTNRIVGTYGYMAPEYAMLGQFSVKSDVFSFGVLMLEIVSGQKITCFRIGENMEYLLSYAWKIWREGTISDFIDPTLSDGPISEMMRCIHIGLLCVQENVVDRPNMISVVLMLNSDFVTFPVPTQPTSFVLSNVESATTLQQDNNSSVTKNLVSITELYPR